MYVINHNEFINPLQVESIKYSTNKLVLNAVGQGQTVAIVTLASGKQHTIDHSVCPNVDEAVKKLVYQIDIANGMKFNVETEENTEETEV